MNPIEANLKALCHAYHYVVVTDHNEALREREHIGTPIAIVNRLQDAMLARIAKRVELFKQGDFKPFMVYAPLDITDGGDIAYACKRLGIKYSQESIVDFVYHGKVTKADSEEE